MKDFFDVGNDELGEKVKKGDLISKGKLSGYLHYGIDTSTGKEDNLLGYIIAEDNNLYLVAIKNRLLIGWEKNHG